MDDLEIKVGDTVGNNDYSYPSKWKGTVVKIFVAGSSKIYQVQSGKWKKEFRKDEITKRTNGIFDN